MSADNKEPGETLAVILIVVAVCIVGWTVFVPFTGLFYRVFHFLPQIIGFRPYYRQWGLLHSTEINVDMRFLMFGVLIGLVLFALASIIRAINANTRELRKIKETLKTTAPK
jgi:hypothetical protein